MMEDKEFLREIAAARLEVDPVSGDELQSIVDEVMATPQDVRDRAAALLR